MDQGREVTVEDATASIREMYFLKSPGSPGLQCPQGWCLAKPPPWSEMCRHVASRLHEKVEGGLGVAPYFYKDSRPTRSGPHPYDFNDLRNLFEGLTSIYYHTGVRSLIYEFVGVGEKFTP